MKGRLNPDGYVMDFGDVKTVTVCADFLTQFVRTECKKLNQKFLLPMLSDVLSVFML